MLDLIIYLEIRVTDSQRLFLLQSGMKEMTFKSAIIWDLSEACYLHRTETPGSSGSPSG